jgi:hypothetical protein
MGFILDIKCPECGTNISLSGCYSCRKKIREYICQKCKTKVKNPEYSINLIDR